MLLIGLCGYKGSGKTTLVNAASSMTGKYIINRISLSEPIEEMLFAFGIPRYVINDKSLWNDPRPELLGKTTRDAAQTIGTEWGRNCIDNDIWITRGLRACKPLSLNIIENVRFENEAKAIIAAGGKLIAFFRPGHMFHAVHASEESIGYIRSNYSEYAFWNNDGIENAAKEFAALLVGIADQLTSLQSHDVKSLP